eukprot:3208001-Alexandrium_andersonii.AAC.1
MQRAVRYCGGVVCVLPADGVARAPRGVLYALYPSSAGALCYGRLTALRRAARRVALELAA